MWAGRWREKQGRTRTAEGASARQAATNVDERIDVNTFVWQRLRPQLAAMRRGSLEWSSVVSIGPVAQLAEQQTLNLRVGGSIPPRLTIFSMVNSLYFTRLRACPKACEP